MSANTHLKPSLFPSKDLKGQENEKDDKLMYIPNDFTQKTFSRLQLVV